MNKIKPVYIEWIDSMHTSGWGHQETDKIGDLRCYTVGWLINKTKTVISVGLSHTANHTERSFGMRLDIPVVAVKKIKHIKL